MTSHTPKRLSMEDRTHTKIARGRLVLEGRVDLHGLTQSEAHSLLLSFLNRAHAEGMRHVLVITGKGASFGSDGVLRRALPRWLATPPFSGLVSGIDEASRRHGGGGAFYIRLKRRHVVVDTAHLSPCATELANLLAAHIASLKDGEIKVLLKQLKAVTGDRATDGT